MRIPRFLSLAAVLLVAACSDGGRTTNTAGSTTDTQKKAKDGTIRVVAQSSNGNQAIPGCSPAAFCPPTPLENLTISGPETVGPVDIPNQTTLEFEVTRGAYTASGSHLYAALCPSVEFEVKKGKITTLTYNQAAKAAGNPSPCTVVVSGPK